MNITVHNIGGYTSHFHPTYGNIKFPVEIKNFKDHQAIIDDLAGEFGGMSVFFTRGGSPEMNEVLLGDLATKQSGEEVLFYREQPVVEVPGVYNPGNPGVHVLGNPGVFEQPEVDMVGQAMIPIDFF